MEYTETERKKIGLKHGNGTFEQVTIQKRNKNKNYLRKKKFFLTYFRIKCGTKQLKRGNQTSRTELFL
jgi:hypothetical protein